MLREPGLLTALTSQSCSIQMVITTRQFTISCWVGLVLVETCVTRPLHQACSLWLHTEEEIARAFPWTRVVETSQDEFTIICGASLEVMAKLVASRPKPADREESCQTYNSTAVLRHGVCDYFEIVSSMSDLTFIGAMRHCFALLSGIRRQSPQWTNRL